MLYCGIVIFFTILNVDKKLKFYKISDTPTQQTKDGKGKLWEHEKGELYSILLQIEILLFGYLKVKFDRSNRT